MASENFKMMDDREYMLHRPEIFIGSMQQGEYYGIYNFQYQKKVYVPALVKIIDEICDNCVDEAIRTNFEHANIISVTIKEDFIKGWYVEITDNGRGIPVVLHDGKYQAELGWTKPRTGSNFDDDGRVTIGRNGVGSSCTNYFSKEFIGKSGNGKELVVVVTQNNCETITTTVEKSKVKGTSVKFFPDLDRFSVKDISDEIISIIKDRLCNLSICYPKITFSFNDEKIIFKNSAHIAKSFSSFAISLEEPNYNLVISSSGDDEEFRHLSYFNGISIKNGGNHIDYFVNGLCTEIIPMIKKKWKIEVLPNQIKQHLLIALWIRNFPNPKFDSQSKERITNTNGEIKAFLNLDFNKIAKKIISTDEIIMPAIDAILRKKEAQEKRNATNDLKKKQKKKIANHIAANSKVVADKILFVAEGQSAIGSLLEVRNPNIHGGYALRGKVLNTHDMSPYDIMKNKELSELAIIIGIDIESPMKYHVDDLNYGRIAALVDSDQDGNSILCLLMMFYSRWPQLFAEGRILRVVTPIYILKKKGKPSRYYYTIEEYENTTDNNTGYEVNYIKGLGSLELDDYKKTIIEDPIYEVITLDDIEKLNMAFGNDADARKVWMFKD